MMVGVVVWPRCSNKCSTLQRLPSLRTPSVQICCVRIVSFDRLSLLSTRSQDSDGAYELCFLLLYLLSSSTAQYGYKNREMKAFSGLKIRWLNFMFISACICLCMFISTFVCLCMFISTIVCLCMLIYACVCLCLFMLCLCCMCYSWFLCAVCVCADCVVCVIVSLCLFYFYVVRACL